MVTRRSLFAAGLAATLPLSSRSETLDAPKGPVILTVTGAISRTNAPVGARLDLAQLDAIDRTSFTTSTPWHNEKVTFEGVRGEVLLKALGASGKEVVATALNDYAAALPIDDFLKHQLLIASRVNGKTMSVREKGPLWIVYPYDSSPNLNTGVFHGRSVWQLAKLEVR